MFHLDKGFRYIKEEMHAKIENDEFSMQFLKFYALERYFSILLYQETLH